MTRVLSYNILLGGTGREEQLATILQAVNPDIIGLVEATDIHIVEELAERLGMQYRITGQGENINDWHLAILSRLPILDTYIHTLPGVFTRKYVLEATLEETTGEVLTVFIIHLTSDFYSRKSIRKRRNEVKAILQLMSKYHGQPHLVMGDFNTITQGEHFYGSALLRYFRRNRRPSAPPPKLREGKKFVRYLIRRLIRIGIYTPLLIPITDRVSRIYAQGGVDLLQEAGYQDCYRSLHPEDEGFTFHSAEPVGRIDYIFASPELAQRMSECDVIREGGGIKGVEASDHLPIYADFAIPIRPEAE